MSKSNMGNKIFDCFTYANEVNLLRARIYFMEGFVNTFVIVEGELDFRGNYKGFSLPSDIEKRKDVEYVKLFKNELDDINSWKREFLSRDSIVRGLENAQPDDIVLLSDLDEFIKPQKISLANNEVVVFEMLWFRYAHDYVCLTAFWSHAIAFQVQLLDKCKPIDLKLIKKSKREGRLLDLKLTTYKNAGWHFSYLPHDFMSIYDYVNIKHSQFPIDFVSGANELVLFSSISQAVLLFLGGDGLFRRDLIWGKVKWSSKSELDPHAAIFKYLPHHNITTLINVKDANLMYIIGNTYNTGRNIFLMRIYNKITILIVKTVDRIIYIFSRIKQF